MTSRQPTATLLTRTSLGSIAPMRSTTGNNGSPPRANKSAPASYPPSKHTPATSTPPTPPTSQPQWPASSTNATDPKEAAFTAAHIFSRSYYSLGEATTQYDQWLNDPKYEPSPTEQLPYSESPPYLPRARTPSPTPANDKHSPDNNHPPPPGRRDARAQTIVQDVHTSPDDPNAVLDSGAMLTTAPRRLLMTTPE